VLSLGLHPPFAYIPVVMATIEHGDERERLTRWYADKSDDELINLAEQSNSLTDVARIVLHSEMSRRNLEIPPTSEIAATGGDPPNIITLRRFRDVPTALLAKSVLDSAGIESFLADINTIQMDWLWSNALGGISLQVRDADAIAAEEILNQTPQEEFEVEGQENFTQPSCPTCQSIDVSYKGLNKRAAYASILFGVPVPFAHVAWRCNSCGHVWEDPEEGQSEHHA
jgi:hypothetical protein